MKTLLLLRHAKSDWDAEYDLDHDRPLSRRGERSARLMGRLTRGLDLTPDLVISSTAVRARTTAHLAAEAGDWNCPIRLEVDLYGSGPDAVIRAAAEAPDVARLMLIGHQPTWSIVLGVLTGVRAEMKTASLAVVEVATDVWSQLPYTQGTLASIHHPRTYFGSEWDVMPGSDP